MLYIDPSTGSMLFTILIGAISVVIYGIKSLVIKLRFSSKSKKGDIESTYSYAIYTDSKRYWNVFKPICDEFENRQIEVNYFTQSEDDPVFSMNYQYVKPEFIGEGNKGFAKMNFINADVLLSSTPSLDIYQWKRSKDCKYYIHIPHACSDITLYKMFGIDYYDAVLLTGDFQAKQIQELEAIRNIKKKDLEVVGLTYFDSMFERIKKKENKKDKKTVLVAPSWGQSALLAKYGSKLIDALLETGYEIIIRPHPQSFVSEKDVIEPLMEKYKEIEWNRDNDNFNVLEKSDILISDFSGVQFDFSLVFDKPIIYTDTSFDSSPYDAWWLKEPLWTFETLPRIGTQLKEEDFKNIKEVIDGCIDSKEFAKGREQARKECWQNKGKAASSIVEYMINKRKEILEGNIE